MAGKTVIRMTLSTSSIDRAIKEIRAYREDFEAKCNRLREAIAERIAWSAEQGFKDAMTSDTFKMRSGGTVTPIPPITAKNVHVTFSHDDTVSVVIANGTDAVFIEFGAGVYHNGAAGDSPHPWGIENGFGIGTYGQGKGAYDVWGYPDGNGGFIITHGTPAAMPMYRGAEEAVRALSDIVQEVFGS